MFTLNSYLNFNGNCREAFQFYQSIFGGELEISTFVQMPPTDEFQLAPGWEDKIMHVSLNIAPNLAIMGSDVPPGMNEVVFGNSVHVSINLENEAEKAAELFEKLSTGGKVVMPFGDTFWEAKYGMFVDKFGINWMINCQMGK